MHLQVQGILLSALWDLLPPHSFPSPFPLVRRKMPWLKFRNPTTSLHTSRSKLLKVITVSFKEFLLKLPPCSGRRKVAPRPLNDKKVHWGRAVWLHSAHPEPRHYIKVSGQLHGQRKNRGYPLHSGTLDQTPLACNYTPIIKLLLENFCHRLTLSVEVTMRLNDIQTATEGQVRRLRPHPLPKGHCVLSHRKCTDFGLV